MSGVCDTLEKFHFNFNVFICDFLFNRGYTFVAAKLEASIKMVLL